MKRLFVAMILLTLTAGCAPQNRTQKGGMYGAAGGAGMALAQWMERLGMVPESANNPEV